jgi:hypothetical protein
LALTASHSLLSHAQTEAEIEAFLRRRRQELGIPEVGEAEIQRRLWLQRLEAFATEGRLPS